MKADSSKRIALGLGSIALALLFALSLMLGAVFLSPKDILASLFGEGDGFYKGIILYSRLPRFFACLLSGAALAVSGAILQSVLGNRLASPSIIGVNAGAGLGASIACSLGLLSGAFFSLSAFLGSLFSIALISIFSRKTGAKKTTVILAGVALNAILSAMSESISALDPEIALLTTDFRIGGFSSLSLSRLLPASLGISLALIVAFSLKNELEIISLGDETAFGLGLRIKKYRIIFLILAALLAGAAVSFAGLLGFIGLIVPHFIKRLFGGGSSKLLPLCALFGGGLVALCDLISRTAFLPYEIPVGILISIIGGATLVALLISSKRGPMNA